MRVLQMHRVVAALAQAGCDTGTMGVCVRAERYMLLMAGCLSAASRIHSSICTLRTERVRPISHHIP
jgi:hypothetical protein